MKLIRSITFVFSLLAFATVAHAGGNNPKDYPGQGATFDYNLSCVDGGGNVFDVGDAASGATTKGELEEFGATIADIIEAIFGVECIVTRTNPGGQSKQTN